MSAIAATVVLIAVGGGVADSPVAAAETPEAAPVYSMSPIGWIRKSGGRTFIVVDERYRPGLLGVEKPDSLWVLYWFDGIDAFADTPVLDLKP